MGKLSAIIITLVLALSLAACDSGSISSGSNTNEPQPMASEPTAAPVPTVLQEPTVTPEPTSTPVPTVSSEPTAPPPSEKISISIGYAPDEISSEYNFFEDDYGDNEVDKIMFSTNIAAKDFNFFEVGYTDDGTDFIFFEASVLYSLDELLPEQPLVVTYRGNGVLPLRGIRYTDEGGTKKYFLILESGEDGSYSLREFENDNASSNLSAVENNSLFDGVTFSEDSYVEINWTYENGGGTAGNEYNVNDIPNITENKSDILTLSIVGNIENNIKVNSLDFIANFENLQAVDFSHCYFSDNIVLPKMNQLKFVRFSWCNLTDLNIVKSNPHITSLGATYNEISDISVLADFTDLVDLSLYGNDISDLSPVSNAKNLERIMLLDGNYEIKSLKPLYGLEKLQAIQISDTVRVNLPQDELDYFNYPNGILHVD